MKLPSSSVDKLPSLGLAASEALHALQAFHKLIFECKAINGSLNELSVFLLI